MTADATLLKDRARQLVGAARALAVGSYMPISKRVPLLGIVDTDDWDFFMTVAAWFIAATKLQNLGVTEQVKGSLTAIVSRDMNDWNDRAIDALEDCQEFYDRTYDVTDDGRFASADAIGAWIVWNVLRRQPDAPSEWQLVRAAGVMVTASFDNWWESDTSPFRK